MSKINNLLLITTSFPITKDGSESAGSFVLDLCLELNQHTKLTILAPYVDKQFGAQGLDVQYFRVSKLPLSNYNPVNPIDIYNIFSAILNGNSAVNNIVENNSIDHILCLWALPCGYWARSALIKKSIPYSVWALGSDIWKLCKLPLVRRILKKVLNDSSLCYADGLELLSQVEGISGKPCSFLPSSRMLKHEQKDRVGNSEPPYNLVFLGRWHENKGVDLMLESLFLLKESDWKKINSIRIAGGGILKNKVKEIFNKLKVIDRPVLLEGFKNKSNAIELLTWADYVMIPSRKESIPVIFSDAIQLNRPVIVTPVGDFPRLINKYNVGVMSDDVTPLSYANAISAALNKSPDKFKIKILKAAEDFNIVSTSKKLLNELSAVT